MAKTKKARKAMEAKPNPPSVATDPAAEFWCDQCKEAKTVTAGACDTCGNRIFANYDPIEE